MSKKKEKGHPIVREKGPFVQNFDYGGPKDGDDVSPGTGLHSGEYDSVEDFLKEKKFRSAQFKSILRSFRLDQLKTIAGTFDE